MGEFGMFKNGRADSPDRRGGNIANTFYERRKNLTQKVPHCSRFTRRAKFMLLQYIYGCENCLVFTFEALLLYYLQRIAENYI